MAEITLEGVVLRRWDSGESDRRIALLTRERGKIYAVARGARKANARLAGVSEPITHTSFGIAIGKSNNYITQAQPLHGFAHIRDDYKRLLCGLAFAEILDAMLPLDEPVSQVFDIALAGLFSIESVAEPLAALSWVDLKLMEASGYSPQFSECANTGESLPAGKVFLSPASGGAVRYGSDLRDAFQVSKEICITLAKLQQLPESPNSMKRAEEVARAVMKFWQEFSGRELPTRRALFLT